MVFRLAGRAASAAGQWWLVPEGTASFELLCRGVKGLLGAKAQRLEGPGGSWTVIEIREPGKPAGAAEAPEGDRVAGWLDGFELAFQGDFESRFLAVSHSFARKFGRPAALWKGEAVSAVLHEEDLPAWKAAIGMLAKAPYRGSQECRWRTPQGWRWMAWDLAAEFDAAGKPVTFRANGSDITKRRLAEEQFHRLSCAVEQSPVAFLITDPEGRVQYVNRRFIETTGNSMEDILDRNLDPLRTGHPDEESYRKFWEQLRKTGEWQGELATARLQRDSLWESVRVSTIRNEAGEVTNLLCLREDITERKRLEDQLRQSQKMESLGTLAGGIAHDFNNMLAIIHGYAEISLGRVGDKDEKMRKYLREIHSAAQRACGLVRQILTFSRKTEVRFAPVSMLQLVKDLTTLMGETFPRTIKFDLDLEESLPDLRGDQNQLQQVIMNLCVNARDAMSSGGTLAISLRRVPGGDLARFNADPTLYYACLSVADTGIGMSPEVRARIFEPFYTTKHATGGTGLGLAVVYGIIMSHFGFIEVASTPGEGSTFSVYLPLTSAKAGMPEIETTLGEFPRGTESVFVVEDEPSLRELLCHVLEQKGYRVQAASDGMEAVQSLASGKSPVDLMLLDMNMPGMDGIGVLKIAQNTHPGVKAIVLSGNLTAEAKAQFAQLGQEEFLEKPYKLEDVGQRIRKILGGKSQ